MEKITFISATQGETLVNGVSVDFKFNYFKEQEGFYPNINKDCIFKVTLSRYALIQWNIINNIDYKLIAKLSFPFVIQWITQRVKDGTLKNLEEKIISTEDNINPYPFDISKVKEVEGYEIVLSFEKTDIGSRIQINIIVDTIIELRDNINALFYKKNKENLFLLVQERNILSLFRKIDNKEQFSYAISTLGNLVTDINNGILRKLSKCQEKDLKSLQLLEQFLVAIDEDPSEVIDCFKTINRIRQGFPVHSDKTGIIPSLKKIKIDYPIDDYDKVWQILLEYYQEGLSKLLVIVKKYAT